MMKGLELSRKYFEEFGRPMLEKEFPEVMPYLAAGLMGSGSECFGFDDDVSRDHDFEPGFCLFLPAEDTVDRKTAFQLERAYAKLPKEFLGYKREAMGPVGGNRHGVIRIDEFFMEKAGIGSSELHLKDWFKIPEYALAELTNGDVFMDNLGLLTDFRETLMCMPEDVRRKKLAGHLLLMAQSGQYNYPRIIKHGEADGAQLAAIEFAQHTMDAVFLLNSQYRPFYKWSFRAMRNLPLFPEMAEDLSILINNGNTPETCGKSFFERFKDASSAAQEKYYLMEDIAARIIEELLNQELTKADCGDLEKHAYSVNDGIENGELRNLNVLFAI